MSEDEKEVLKQLQECTDLLLQCSKEGKKCRWCRRRNDCRYFVRSVLGVICRLQLIYADISEDIRNTKHMFI